jgi:hypothetical protein
MAKTKAVMVMRAADKVRLSDRRVSDAQRALSKALKAREKAESHYLRLVSESVANPRSAAGEAGSLS